MFITMTILCACIVHVLLLTTVSVSMQFVCVEVSFATNWEPRTETRFPLWWLLPQDYNQCSW